MKPGAFSTGTATSAADCLPIACFAPSTALQYRGFFLELELAHIKLPQVSPGCIALYALPTTSQIKSFSLSRVLRAALSPGEPLFAFPAL